MDTVWILRYLYRVFHTFTLSAKLRMQMACQVLHSKWSSPKLMIGIQPPWLGCWNPRKNSHHDVGWRLVSFWIGNPEKKKKKPSKLPRLHPGGGRSQLWSILEFQVAQISSARAIHLIQAWQGGWRCNMKVLEKKSSQTSQEFFLFHSVWRAQNLELYPFQKNSTGSILKWNLPKVVLSRKPQQRITNPTNVYIPYTLYSWMRKSKMKV